MAAGAVFLGMQPPRLLRVFYLQAEVQYHYLRERVKDVRLPSRRLWMPAPASSPHRSCGWCSMTPGWRRPIRRSRRLSAAPPDIIAIDPIRNVFDGGDAGGENDNGAMLFFLSQRVERIRQAVNPDAGVILAHHTKKLGKSSSRRTRSRHWPALEVCAVTTRPGCCCSGRRDQNDRQLILSCATARVSRNGMSTRSTASGARSIPTSGW